jgi:capsular polysaccharide transport system permease protein
MLTQRTPWKITLSVWHALFLREMLTRLFANPYAWFWLFVEPLLYVIVMIAIRNFIQFIDNMYGAEVIPWMILGLVAFFLFRDGLTRSMSAVGANQALFAYRQVKPIDTVITRNFVEGFVRTIVLLKLLLGTGLLGYDVIPYDAIKAMLAWASIWMLGLSAGLCLSVMIKLVPELEIMINIMTLPLLILSGVILPIQMFPFSVQEIIAYNPIVHGLELLRLSFFEGYWTYHGVNFRYLYYWISLMTAFGLLLHLRFEKQLQAK